jgi:hypothetical protein
VTTIGIAREQTRARHPEETGYIERDGVRVFWERYGDGAPRVLFLPDVVDRPFAGLEGLDCILRASCGRADVRWPR